jgi:hypothetical protein
MASVLISNGIFFPIGLAIAVPGLLLARYTRVEEPWGNRLLGLVVEGLRVGEIGDRAGY